MGITNFCVLVHCLQESWDVPRPFDSILYDAQSLLHAGISCALETQEEKLFQEVAVWAWRKMEMTLHTLLSLSCAARHLTCVISFDGEGVPMKWPTQRNRRKDISMTPKTHYRSALFGVNTIALHVQDYFKRRLRHFQLFTVDRLKVILSGCNVPGEGEHKLFHIAEVYGCQRPMVVSDDQDVFIIALMRMDRYQMLQVYRYHKFYPIHTVFQTWAPYTPKQLEIISFLFGNDFIPAMVGITLQNAPDIHYALSECDEGEDPPSLMAQFLEQRKEALRFQTVSGVDEDLIDSFWITFLWLKDYYTQHRFPQKYLENTLYDAFDRNALLTALMSPEYSTESFHRAHTRYRDTVTQPPRSEQAIQSVFKKEHLEPYWVTPTDTLCTVIDLKKRSSRATLDR